MSLPYEVSQHDWLDTRLATFLSQHSLVTFPAVHSTVQPLTELGQLQGHVVPWVSQISSVQPLCLTVARHELWDGVEDL